MSSFTTLICIERSALFAPFTSQLTATQASQTSAAAVSVVSGLTRGELGGIIGGILGAFLVLCAIIIFLFWYRRPAQANLPPHPYVPQDIKPESGGIGGAPRPAVVEDYPIDYPEAQVGGRLRYE